MSNLYITTKSFAGYDQNDQKYMIPEGTRLFLTEWIGYYYKSPKFTYVNNPTSSLPLEIGDMLYNNGYVKELEL